MNTHMILATIELTDEEAQGNGGWYVTFVHSKDQKRLDPELTFGPFDTQQIAFETGKQVLEDIGAEYLDGVIPE